METKKILSDCVLIFQVFGLFHFVLENQFAHIKSNVLRNIGNIMLKFILMFKLLVAMMLFRDLYILIALNQTVTLDEFILGSFKLPKMKQMIEIVGVTLTLSLILVSTMISLVWSNDHKTFIRNILQFERHIERDFNCCFSLKRFKAIFLTETLLHLSLTPLRYLFFIQFRDGHFQILRLFSIFILFFMTASYLQSIFMIDLVNQMMAKIVMEIEIKQENSMKWSTDEVRKLISLNCLVSENYKIVVKTQSLHVTFAFLIKYLGVSLAFYGLLLLCKNGDSLSLRNYQDICGLIAGTALLYSISKSCQNFQNLSNKLAYLLCHLQTHNFNDFSIADIDALHQYEKNSVSESIYLKFFGLRNVNMNFFVSVIY